MQTGMFLQQLKVKIKFTMYFSNSIYTRWTQTEHSRENMNECCLPMQLFNGSPCILVTCASCWCSCTICCCNLAFSLLSSVNLLLCSVSFSLCFSSRISSLTHHSHHQQCLLARQFHSVTIRTRRPFDRLIVIDYSSEQKEQSVVACS